MNTLSVTVSESAPKKQKMLTYFARITQFLVWPITFILLRLFFKIHIQGQQHLSKIKSPFIIISNHVAYFDCFLFREVLGFATPHLPLRFMAVRSFSSNFLNFFTSLGLVDLTYALFGVFTIIQGQGVEKNLETATRIINSGGNIVIYPEGHVTRSKGSIDDFKIGAAVLARKTGVNILPVSFKLGEASIFRRALSVNIGRPYSIDPALSDKENTIQSQKTVLDLYNVIK